MAAISPQADDVDMESVLEVWTMLTPPFKKLLDDVVCSVPDPKIKDAVRQKFAAAEAPLKSALGEQIAALKAKFSQQVPGKIEVDLSPLTRKVPGPIQVADIRRNLADEWSDSLDALVRCVIDHGCSKEALDQVTKLRDHHMAKVEASIDGFEAQYSERVKGQVVQSAFDHVDFNRQSLEFDAPFSNSSGSKVRFADSDQEMTLVEKVQFLEETLEAKGSELKQLQQDSVFLTHVCSTLGCEPNMAEVEVLNLDHTQCEQRITQLEGLLASKDAAIKAEQDKIQAYTGTIKLLRDELHKLGAIRGTICERLHQLGLSVVSSAASASSSNSTVDVRSRYGCNDCSCDQQND